MPMFINMQQNKSFSEARGTLTGRHTSNNILDMLSNGTSQKSGLHMF